MLSNIFKWFIFLLWIFCTFCTAVLCAQKVGEQNKLIPQCKYSFSNAKGQQKWNDAEYSSDNVVDFGNEYINIFKIDLKF